MRSQQLYSVLKVQAKQFIGALAHLKVRLRYPYALPSEIGNALGLSLDDTVLFPSLLDILSNLQKPGSLARFMTRKQAERCFCKASRCEKFTTSSLYSFRFNEGWVEFELQFDEEDKLRRLFLIHKEIHDKDRLEIPLH